MRYIGIRESVRDFGNYISDFFESGYKTVKANSRELACGAAITVMLAAPACNSTPRRDWREVESRPAGTIFVREPSTYDKYFSPSHISARGIDRVRELGAQEGVEGWPWYVRAVIDGFADALIVKGVNAIYEHYQPEPSRPALPVSPKVEEGQPD